MRYLTFRYLTVFVEDIVLEAPGKEELESWEDEYLDELREQRWLGRPNYTAELHLLDGTRKPVAGSTSLLEDKVSDLNLYAFLVDVEYGSMKDQDRDFYKKLNRLNEVFRNRTLDMEVYLTTLYDMVPGEKVMDQRIDEAEVSNLEDNLYAAEEIEDAMRASPDYSFISVEVSGEESAASIDECYSSFQESTGMEIKFEYTGNTSAYRRFASQYPDQAEDSDGVPGRAYIDSGSPDVDIPTASRVGVNQGRVQEWLSKQLEDIE